MRKLIFKLNYYLFQLLFFRMCMDIDSGKIRDIGFLFPILPFSGWSKSNPYRTFVPGKRVWIFWTRKIKFDSDKIESK